MPGSEAGLAYLQLLFVCGCVDHRGKSLEAMGNAAPDDCRMASFVQFEEPDIIVDQGWLLAVLTVAKDGADFWPRAADSFTVVGHEVSE